jgi:hypothetical protein
MMFVDKKRLEEIGAYQPGKQPMLVTFASDLEWRPGEWPEVVALLDEKHQGFLFFRGASIVHGGEFAGYVYQSKDGTACWHVFND